MATTAPRKGLRATRVKLLGSILALVLLENGRQIRARLNQLSLNGGLLSLESPLDEGIRVTVLFHVGLTSMRCRAQMLFPMWATQGCLQNLPPLDRTSPDTMRQYLRSFSQCVGKVDPVLGSGFGTFAR